MTSSSRWPCCTDPHWQPCSRRARCIAVVATERGISPQKWRMYDTLFQNQNDFNKILNTGRGAQVNTPQFCLTVSNQKCSWRRLSTPHREASSPHWARSPNPNGVWWPRWWASAGRGWWWPSSGAHRRTSSTGCLQEKHWLLNNQRIIPT